MPTAVGAWGSVGVTAEAFRCTGPAPELWWVTQFSHWGLMGCTVTLLSGGNIAESSAA